MHFYVERPYFDLEKVVQGQMRYRLNLTLKNLAKVKSDITKRFAAYGFLKVDCTLKPLEPIISEI